MCISPTAIVVLPTPELVPATTMVGTLAVGSAVRTRMTVEIQAARSGANAVLEESANTAREIRAPHNLAAYFFALRSE